MLHPTMLIFEEHAVQLKMRHSPVGLEEAVAGLAEWMDQAAERLTEADWAFLGELGGVLWRESLARRNP